MLDYDHKPEGYYENTRPEMLGYLPGGASTVLDVGCSDGRFGALLKEETGAAVWGIEPMAQAARRAEKVLDRVIQASVEEAIAELPDGYFDVIYFNDVLEHLVDPGDVLVQMKSKLVKNGVVISSIPNIRYFRTLFKFLFRGDWTYTDEGIMDRTHLRFFTRKSIKSMYESAGYTVKRHEGINASKSIKPRLFNLIMFGSASDVKFLQFATVGSPD